MQPFLFSAQKPSRARKEPEKFVLDTANTSPKCPPATEIHVILSEGYTSNKKRGWSAKALGVLGMNWMEKFRTLVLYQNAKELRTFLQLLPSGKNHGHQRKSGQFKEQNSKFSPITMRYLAEAWGVGIHLPKTLLDRVGIPYPVARASPNHKSHIESLEAAKICFSARTLYIN
jgi:hypothetical protein